MVNSFELAVRTFDQHFRAWQADGGNQPPAVYEQIPRRFRINIRVDRNGQKTNAAVNAIHDCLNETSVVGRALHNLRYSLDFNHTPTQGRPVIAFDERDIVAARNFVRSMPDSMFQRPNIGQVRDIFFSLYRYVTDSAMRDFYEACFVLSREVYELLFTLRRT